MGNNYEVNRVTGDITGVGSINLPVGIYTQSLTVSGIPVNINNDHGALTGLTDDDHTQYLRTDGTRTLTGSMNFGSFSLTNVGAVGVTTVNSVITNTSTVNSDTGIFADSLTVSGLPVLNELPPFSQQIFDVTVFGADNTANFDSTSAINAAVDAARAWQVSPGYGTLDTAYATIYFPAGIYKVDTLDFTGLVGINVVGGSSASYGCSVYGMNQSTARPIFDFTGSSSVNVRGIVAAGQQPSGDDASVTPTVGFLFAESSATGDANKNRMDDCGAVGKFTAAALYIYGCSDNNFYGCAFQNQIDTGEGVVRFIGDNNTYSVSSTYATINNGTGRPSGDQTFVGCEFHANYTTPVSANYTSRFYNTYAVRTFGGNHDNTGWKHVLFNGNTNRGILFEGVQFYSEGGTPAEALIFSDNAVVDGLTINTCEMQTGGAFNTSTGHLLTGSGTPIFDNTVVIGIPAEYVIGSEITQATVINSIVSGTVGAFSSTLTRNGSNVIAADGATSFTGNQSMGGNKITSLSELPTTDTDSIPRSWGTNANNVTFTLGDDSVVRIDNVQTSVMVFITCVPFSGSAGPTFGAVFLQQGTAGETLFGNSAGTYQHLGASDTPPTGSTSTDGNLGFQFASTTSNRFWIENRLGNTVTFRLYFFGPTYNTAAAATATLL